MKKYIIAALLLTMLVLPACGAKDTDSPSGDTTETVPPSASGEPGEVSEETLLEEGFTRVEKTAAPELTVDEIIAALQSGEGLPGPGGGFGYAESLRDSSGFEEVENYEKPQPFEVVFSDDGWREDVEYAEWETLMSEEELAELRQYEAEMSGSPGELPEGSDSGDLPLNLPSPPGTPGSPVKMEGTFMLTSSGVTKEQCATYFEACKQVGFTVNIDEMDASSFGMGYIWSAEDSSGNYLTIMYKDDSLQVILEAVQ